MRAKLTATNFIAIMMFTVSTATGQAPPADAATTWTPTLTPDGQPDLQGSWSYETITLLERPKEFGERLYLTPEERAKADLAASHRPGFDTPPTEGTPGSYNAAWLQLGKSDGRTSLIVDPTDGRLPPLVAAIAQKAASPEAQRLRLSGNGLGLIDSYEDMATRDRCIQHFKAGPPFHPVPTTYNLNLQIVQAADHVAILTEQNGPRIIPVDGRPHIRAEIRQWLGDSRGRWEGHTLVVETTNFNGRHDFGGRPVLPLADVAEAGRRMTLVERFTRVNADTIDYEYTVNNPGMWTRPWTAAFQMRRLSDRLYEFACHEGNHSLVNMLSGSRAKEKLGSR